MLEYLKFDIGGYFGGYYTLDITIQDDCVSYIASHEFGPEEEDMKNCTSKKSLAFTAEWVAKLEKIHINRWHSLYKPNYLICDGTQWGLDYKVVGKRCRHISGDNEYPDNWNDFIDLLYKLASYKFIKESRIENEE